MNETVEVVIKIPKQDFDFIKDEFADGNMPDEKDLKETTYYAIANGTVLTKGREYIDRNNAITSICQYYATCERMKMFYFTPNLIKQEVVNILIKEPTIIGADREVDNER